MIHINCHEPQEIIELLQAKTEIKVSNFTPADYVIGTIGIERKTISEQCLEAYQMSAEKEQRCYSNSLDLCRKYFVRNGKSYGKLQELVRRQRGISRRL